MCQMPARLTKPGDFFLAMKMHQLIAHGARVSRCSRLPRHRARSGRSKHPVHRWDISEARRYLGIETITVHAEVGWRVPQPQHARQQNDFARVSVIMSDYHSGNWATVCRKRFSNRQTSLTTLPLGEAVRCSAINFDNSSNLVRDRPTFRSPTIVVVCAIYSFTDIVGFASSSVRNRATNA